MKIGSITSENRGETDQILVDLAAKMQANGKRLVGIVKDVEYESRFENGCDMRVRVLPDGPVIPITQSLGDGSGACRLDPAGITLAVQTVINSNLKEADLFILNKFGPEEGQGRGFRDAISLAVSAGVPVLVGLGSGAEIRSKFDMFCGGVAEAIAPDLNKIERWVDSDNQLADRNRL